MRVRILKGLIAPKGPKGQATVSLDPHAVAVTAQASGLNLTAVGAPGTFAATPAAIVTPHRFIVSDKDTFLGGSQQDHFDLSEKVSGSQLDVFWSSDGGSTITQIAYLVIGEVATPTSCGNLRQLSEFGQYATVALAEQTLASALAQMTQANGGTLCIPLDAPTDFHPRNLVQATPAIQTASVTPGVTVLDLRSGSELRYVPPIGTVLSDGARACWASNATLPRTSVGRTSGRQRTSRRATQVAPRPTARSSSTTRPRSATSTTFLRCGGSS